MSEVSEGGVELFTQLVEWEMFGGDACPKALLRAVSLADLSIASKGLDDRGGLGEFVTSQMVEMEMLYRIGRIKDWGYVRDGDNVTLNIETKHAVNELMLKFTMQEANA